jgi:hypothetical protein
MLQSVETDALPAGFGFWAGTRAAGVLLIGDMSPFFPDLDLGMRGGIF